MKSTLFVAAIACILSIAFAVESEKVNEVNNEVVSYIREHLSIYPMSRGPSNHFDCYNDLTLKINNITDEANEVSEQCIKDANLKRTGTLDQLKVARSELTVNVTSIHNSFFECARKSPGLDYFKCLKTTVQNDASIMSVIEQKADNVISQYSTGLQETERKERECLAGAIQTAKTKTDDGFKTLSTCLGQGNADN